MWTWWRQCARASSAVDVDLLFLLESNCFVLNLSARWSRWNCSSGYFLQGREYHRCLIWYLSLWSCNLCFVVHVEVTVDEADIFFKEETWPEYARPATCVAIALTALVALYYHSVVTFKHCQCLDQTLFRHCHDRAMSILLNLPKLPSPDSFLACLLWQVLERRKSQGDSI